MASWLLLAGPQIRTSVHQDGPQCPPLPDTVDLPNGLQFVVEQWEQGRWVFFLHDSCEWSCPWKPCTQEARWLSRRRQVPLPGRQCRNPAGQQTPSFFPHAFWIHCYILELGRSELFVRRSLSACGLGIGRCSPTVHLGSAYAPPIEEEANTFFVQMFEFPTLIGSKTILMEKWKYIFCCVVEVTAFKPKFSKFFSSTILWDVLCLC